MTRGDGLPALAVVYDPRWVSLLHLVKAARGRWRPIWLIDTSVDANRPIAQSLATLGPVISVADGAGDAAADLATHAPDGIVAFADDQLVLTALLADELGLRFHRPDVARLLTDKYAQRAALRAAGLNVPCSRLIAVNADAAARYSSLSSADYPAILKPREGYGGALTQQVHDGESALRLFEEFAAIAPRDFVLETMIPDGIPRDEQVLADYVSVESVVTDGQVTHLAVTGDLPLANPFRETGNFVPCALSESHRAAVMDTASAALHALGATYGVFHTEVKLAPTGPVIIEVNGRLGGDVPDLIRLAGGHDIFAMVAGQALGPSALGPSTADDLPWRYQRVGYIANVQAPMEATELTSLHGLDTVRGLPEVELVDVNRRPGDRLDWRDGTQGFVYSVLGSAPDHEVMLARLADIEKVVSLEFT